MLIGNTPISVDGRGSDDASADFRHGPLQRALALSSHSPRCTSGRTRPCSISPIPQGTVGQRSADECGTSVTSSHEQRAGSCFRRKFHGRSPRDAISVPAFAIRLATHSYLSYGRPASDEDSVEIQKGMEFRSWTLTLAGPAASSFRHRREFGASSGRSGRKPEQGQRQRKRERQGQRAERPRPKPRYLIPQSLHRPNWCKPHGILSGYSRMQCQSRRTMPGADDEQPSSA